MTPNAVSQSDTPTSIPGMAVAPGASQILQSGVPAVPSELRARLQQYLQARQAGLADVAPDGKSILIATRFANTAQLHLVEFPLGARQQLTFGDEPVSGGRFLPDDERHIIYQQDQGGSETYQYYLLDRKSGRSYLLTDGKSRHGALRIAPRRSADGRIKVAFANNARNGKDMDVYVADFDPTETSVGLRAARRITELSGSHSPVSFTSDGRQLLASEFRAADDADLYVIDLATGQRRMVTPADGKGSIRGAKFSSADDAVLFVTDRYGDFNHLYTRNLSDLATSAPPTPLTPDLKWDIEDLEVAAGGEVIIAVNEDGISKLYTVTAGAKRMTLPLNVTGVVSALLAPAGRPGEVFVAVDSPQSPSDIYNVPLRSRRAVQRWTKSEVGGLDPSTFVVPSVVRYPSTDGFTVPAFLYLPPQAAGARVPTLVIWHGGPEGQSRPNFSAFIQYLVCDLGLAVLMPNVRGSDGYGKAYLAADNGVLREKSLKDIGATLDFIAQHPRLDPDRVAVYGGSYGGYMTLCTATFYSDRIRAAVDVVGVSSIASFLQNTQAYRRDLRRREYGDERVPEVREVQDRISPLHHVDKVTCALFVQQGKNDPRVPQSEAEQIVKAVREKAGGAADACWYLLGLNEGHGFAKKENRDHALAATVLFLKEKLLAKP